jgi:maltose O-acetyltransferase
MIRLSDSVTGAIRYGDGPQRSALLALFKGFHKLLSTTKFHAAAEGAQIRQHAPLQLLGPGRITIRGTIEIGTPNGAHILTGVFIGARTSASKVFVDDGTAIGNANVIISEGAEIRIGKRVLIGANFFCVDTNFHELPVERRRNADASPRPVVIDDDVFIGDGVKILKGVHIGAGSIIAAGAVLLPDFNCPPGSTVAGNPAQIIRRQD